MGITPFIEFLQGPHGTKSSSRLLCFMALCAAIFFGSIVVSGKGGQDGAMIVYAFLAAAFGGSVSNKMVERTECKPQP